MSIDDIISAVRYCIDEQASNTASFGNASANDNIYMDNIIKNKIGDALRWVCLYAPAELLAGTDEYTTTTNPNDTPVDTGIIVDVAPTPSALYENKAGLISLESNFIKLARVRVAGWHRAVKAPISEDSEEYYQLFNTYGATATYDRPQAAIVDKATKQMELWPWKSGDSVALTYVASVEPVGIGSPITAYAFPPLARTSIIYYIAFLLLSAYNDPRAEVMFNIAKANLGNIEK